MGSYKLLDEHLTSVDTSGETPQHISTSPNWIMMIIRYKEPVTSSKTRLAHRTSDDTGDVSQDDDTFKLTDTKSPIIITSSCVQMDITSSKGSFTQNLNAALRPGRVEFLSAIMPGDWCFCWIMNTKEKYLEVIKKITEESNDKENQSSDDTGGVNGFEDGLKFVGKVQDIRKVIAQSPTGARTVQYNLSGVGFGEFDSSVFFDPALARQESYLAKTLADMNIAMKDFFNAAADKSTGSGGVSVNKMIPALITAFFGKGLSGVGVASGGLQLGSGASIATQEAPFAYVIPDGVGKILGVKKASKGSVHCYADILEIIQGLQKYKHSNYPDMFFPNGTTPNDVQGRQQTRHTTDNPLKGVFLPVPSAFSGQSVWNLLNEYLNPAINEMYTALKYTPSGKVMPTLVVRQLPFSSPILSEQLGDEVTAYHELPRWVGSDLLMRSLDIGRSDGARTNFIHIYGELDKPILASRLAFQIVKWPPISDPVDMKRHGLRPHMGTVRCAATQAVNAGPGLWMQIKADFLLGQHLMLTGRCSMTGVTLPIAPGDNFEYDDILYHIESVNHHVEISADGHKSFTTQLSLTHGMRANVSAALDKFSMVTENVKGKSHRRPGSGPRTEPFHWDVFGPGGPQPDTDLTSQTVELKIGERGENLDIYLYSGIDSDDNRGLEPGVLIVDTEDYNK